MEKCLLEIYFLHWCNRWTCDSNTSTIIEKSPNQTRFFFSKSQLKERLEYLFKDGLFFWKLLRFDILTIIEIIYACARLHNFLIDRKISILKSIRNIPPIASTLNDFLSTKMGEKI